MTRLGLLVLLTLFACLLPFLAAPAAVLRPRLRSRLQSRSARLWACGVAAIIGMEIRIKGVPPKDPSLVVSNHLGYLDIVPLLMKTDALFVAKAEISKWPMAGAVCRAWNTIFLDRARKRDLPRAIEAMTTSLRAGKSVIFFPEGTCTPGARVLPFKSSLFEAAVRSGRPVSCAGISYSVDGAEPPAHRSICWWDATVFLQHLYRLLQIRTFQASVVFHGTVSGDHRKKLAAGAHRAVSANFIPLVSDIGLESIDVPVSRGFYDAVSVK
jgi:1-acyl-sn-glycerol-3-phosphate acyltransferase